MLKPLFENFPDELTQLRQWVNWRLTPRKEGGKPTKPPLTASGKAASTDDPTTWAHFSTAKSAASKFDGIGFVLTKDDPYVAFDFDHCRCPALPGINPAISPLDAILPEIAAHIKLLNSYTEPSPSGKGIRVFAKGTLPVDGKRRGPIEVYQAGRYVTVTGHSLAGFPRTIEPRQMEIDAFYKQVFGTLEEPRKEDAAPRQDAPSADWKAIRDRALQSKSGPEIQRLWNGDFSAYPSQSEGDMALCSHLAFWLAGDATAMDAAFRASGLFRKKWDERHGRSTYGEQTIQKAISGSEAHYDKGHHSQEGAVREKTSPEEWAEPVLFGELDVPEIPSTLLPVFLGRYCQAVTAATQTPMGLAVMYALSVVATTLQ